MYFKNSKLYDILAFVGRIVLPALATLYGSLASIWGLPFSKEIPETIMAIDLCLNVILGIAKSNYDNLKTDGYEIK